MRHNTPTTPKSDTRLMAAAWRQLFVACTQAGFTDEQAMEILLVVLDNSWGDHQ